MLQVENNTKINLYFAIITISLQHLGLRLCMPELMMEKGLTLHLYYQSLLAQTLGIIKLLLLLKIIYNHGFFGILKILERIGVLQDINMKILKKGQTVSLTITDSQFLKFYLCFHEHICKKRLVLLKEVIIITQQNILMQFIKQLHMVNLLCFWINSWIIIVATQLLFCRRKKL